VTPSACFPPSLPPSGPGKGWRPVLDPWNESVEKAKRKAGFESEVVSQTWQHI
jgi:hypothetical protein